MSLTTDITNVCSYFYVDNHSAKLEVGLVIQTLSAACSLAKVECIQLSFG